jgi:hypothetical protein
MLEIDREPQPGHLFVVFEIVEVANLSLFPSCCLAA